MANPDLNAMPVSVPTWLESSISEGWRLLWLTLPNGQSGALVPVDGVTSGNQLGELADKQAGVAWVDRKQSLIRSSRSTVPY